MLAARVSLITSPASGLQTLGQGLVRVIRTDDEALFVPISRVVACCTGQDALAQVIEEGMEARKWGNEETAEARLGRAVQLAHQSGDRETARLLATVVEVIDPATAMVWLKRRRYERDDS
jgi:von Willebrand factor type A C-terminal domain